MIFFDDMKILLYNKFFDVLNLMLFVIWVDFLVYLVKNLYIEKVCILVI